MSDNYILLTINSATVLSTLLLAQMYGATCVNRGIVLYILEVYGLVDVISMGPRSPYYTDDMDRVEITELGKKCHIWEDQHTHGGTVIIPLDESHE